MPGLLATIRHEGVVQAVDTVTFSANDASVYLRPIGAPRVVYDFGFVDVPAEHAAWNFDTAGQLQASERPHFSIHDTGKCHVRTGSGRDLLADASEIGPLNAFRGAHVGASSPVTLRSFRRSRTSGRTPEPVMTTQNRGMSRLPRVPVRSGSRSS